MYIHTKRFFIWSFSNEHNVHDPLTLTRTHGENKGGQELVNTLTS